jgi:hypothetical protein
MTAIANVSLTNTFDEWRTITNQLVFLANEVEANGNLVRVQSNTSAIRVTANIGRGDIIYISANVSYNIADQSRANLASANVVNAVHNVLTVAFAQANTSYNHANAAFFQANQAFLEANTAETWAVAAFNRGNNVFIHANSSYNQANQAFFQANQAFLDANTAETWSVAAFNRGNTVFTHANSSYNQANQAFSQANAANVLAFNSAAGANAWVNTVYGFTNTYTRAVGTAGNTYAEATAAGANAYTRVVGTAGNTYAEATAAGANAYTRVVGTAGNTYAMTIGTSSNAWTNTVFGLSNAYTQAVGTAGNTYAETTAAGANAYTRVVGTAGNNYTITVSAASNAWTNTVFGLSNAYTQAVGAAGNTYARVVGTAGNTYAQVIGLASNVMLGDAFFQANQAFAVANNAAGNTTILIGSAFGQANQAFNTANTAAANALGAFLRSNITFTHANAAFFQANQAFAVANAAPANAAFFQANQAFNTANTSAANALGAFSRSNITFTHANAAFFQANQAFVVANTANIRAEDAHSRIDTLVLTSNSNTAIVTDIALSAFNKANLANITAENSFFQANQAFFQANQAFAKANSTTYTSNVVISVTDNTNAALRITQTGTGDVIRVEDSATDATPFVINSSGYVGIGASSPSVALDVEGTTVESFVGTGSVSGNVLSVTIVTSGTLSVGDYITFDNFGLKFGAYIRTFSTGSGGTGNYFLSESGSVSSSTFRSADLRDRTISITKNDSVIQPGEPIGLIQFKSTDASIDTKDETRAFLGAQAISLDGSVDLILGTAVGTNSASERLRITKDGALSFNGAAVGAAGTILRSQGASLPMIYEADKAYDQANAANVLAFNSAAGANAWANVIGVNANAYANVVGQRSNNFALSLGTQFNSINTYVTLTGTAVNAITGSAFFQANQAFAQANAANVLAFNSAAGANAWANTIGVRSNNFALSLGTQFNSINTYVTLTGTAVNAISGAAFFQANQAFFTANNALPKTGGTISGDLIISGNITISGNTTYTNTQTLLIGDNIFVLNADLPSTSAPSENAGMTVNRGNAANAEIIWNETNDRWTFNSGTGTYLNLASNTDVDTTGLASNAYANVIGQRSNNFALSLGTQFNSLNTYVSSTGTAVNAISGAAFFQANQAFFVANTSGDEAEGAFLRANGAFNQANQAFAKANSTSFTSNVVISVADSTNAALRITQTGTGIALLVEDSTNPDSTPTVITDAGRIVTGSDTAYSVDNTYGGQITPRIQTHGTVTESATLAATLWTTSGAGSQAVLSKSRSGTIGTNTIVQNNDDLGAIVFDGDDGSLFTVAASIVGSVDGTPGANNMPGRLVFSTTANGASVPTERMRITANGNIGIGTTSPSANLHVVGNAIISTALTVGTINVAPTIGAAFDKANAANVLAFTSGNEAEGAFLRGNVSWFHANAAFFQANQAFSKANAANVLAFNALPKTGGTLSGGLSLGTTVVANPFNTGSHLTLYDGAGTSRYGLSISTGQLNTIIGTVSGASVVNVANAEITKTNTSGFFVFGNQRSYAGLTEITSVTPTSGSATVTISGLDLSIYKMLLVECHGITSTSVTAPNYPHLLIGGSTTTDVQFTSIVFTAGSDYITAFCYIDLLTAKYHSSSATVTDNTNFGTGGSVYCGDTDITASDTSISISFSASTFTASGTIKLYGIS